MRDDFISKSELLTNLIHCKGLSRLSFGALIEFLEDYPIEVDMDNIKKQIIDMDIPSEYENLIKDNLMEILDKGGV